MTKQKNCFLLMFGLLLLLGCCFHLLLVELFAGNGQAHHKGYKLLKIHLSIPVGIEILHNLVYGSRIFLTLQWERQEMQK